MIKNSRTGPYDPVRFIGCCGAYCKTCKAFIGAACKGCKLGYDNGERDINKAKCIMKICCLRNKKMETCADCLEYSQCKKIYEFQNKNGYKYKKYKESIEYIKKNSYPAFFRSADKWNDAFGKLK